ncbi:hypothetical protein QR680_007035 [Steinernema hermaphroditum]|uniref:F-box domain-containing protein n=1 Tax=Steinernema hermaphroditum TaxID=289476 RepID=A0AA39HXE3_9BILA|nr:hypothetical protein QR680_007035 [Steinernema hermaphroditum]
MDRLPYVFLESVAAALNKSDLEQLLLISGTWSSAASIHHAKRHNLEVLLSPSDQDDGEVEVDFIIPETGDRITSVDTKHHRIMSIMGARLDLGNPKISVEQFRNTTMPLLCTLASQCTLTVLRMAQFRSTCSLDLTGIEQYLGSEDSRQRNCL